MDIKELQEFSRNHSNRLAAGYLKGYDSEKRIFHAAVKAMEEVGELSNAILKYLGAQRSEKLEGFSKKEVEGEIADVLIVTGILAHLMDVNVEEALKNKIKVVESGHKEPKP